LLASVFSSLVPLVRTSAAGLCTMECCIGTAPHVAGACGTGLMKKPKNIEVESEVLCGLKLAHRSPAFITATRLLPRDLMEPPPADVHQGWCGSQSEDSDTQAVRVGTNRELPVALITVPAMRNPCGSDCGQWVSGYLRKPGSSGTAPENIPGLARPPDLVRLRESSARIFALNSHHEPAQPRGPPASLS
jgi:hypothetical protein